MDINWAPVQQATGNLMNTGVTVGMGLRRENLIQQQLAQHQQVVDQQSRMLKIQADQAEYRAAQAKKPIDITANPAYLAMSSEGQKNALNWFESQGYTKGGIGTTEDVMTGLGQIEGSKQLFSTFMAPEVTTKKNAYVQKFNEQRILMQNGELDKAKKLQPALESLRMDYESASGNFLSHIEKLELADQKAQETATNLTTHTVEVGVGGDMTQKMGYNPKTKAYDTPIGLPYPKHPKEQTVGAKDEKKALSDDYNHLRASYNDILKSSWEAPVDFSPEDKKAVQDSTRKALTYLTGIRGNRTKIDEAMTHLESLTNKEAWVPNTPTAASGPKVGEVVKGYKFKGGNPADQKNWVK